MTAAVLDVTVPTAVPRPRRSAGRALQALELVSVIAAAAGFGYALLASGGRDRGAALVATALALPLVAAAQAWRRVPPREFFLVASIPAAAVLVPFVTSLGLADARDLDVYLYAPVLYAGLRAFLRDRPRRQLVVALLLAAGAFEYWETWPTWVGMNDRSYRLVGTFYWHNQFGVFAAAIAIVGVVCVIRGDRAMQLLGWIVAPISIAMCYLSHSRASELALLVAATALAAILLRQKTWRPAVRTAGVIAAAIAVSALMLATVASTKPQTGTVAALTNASLSSSTGYRWHFWVAALHVFAHSPITGHGYGSFFLLSGPYLPGGGAITTWVHSAPLQAMDDGGILLGIPVVLAMLLVAWRCVRTLLAAFRDSDRLDPLRLAASLGVIALLFHACLDFDSQYPVLVALVAALAATAAPDSVTSPVPAVRMRSVAPALAILVGAIATGAVLVTSYWSSSDRIATATKQVAAGDVTHGIATAAGGLRSNLPDPRAAAFIVEQAATGTQVDQHVLAQALRESRAYMHVNKSFVPSWQREHAAEVASLSMKSDGG